MNFSSPDRNMVIGAFAALLVFVLDLVGSKYGFDKMPPEVAAALPVLIGFLVAHFVPQTDDDLIKKLDDSIVNKAQADRNSNVSYEIDPVPVPPGEAAKIVPPAPKTV